MSKKSSYPLYKSILVIGATSELFFLLIKKLLPYVEKFVCIGRNQEHLHELKALYPSHVEIHAIDLEDEKSFDFIEHLIKTHSFDALLQFQGYGLYGLFEEISWQDHEKILQLNLNSLMRIFQLFAKFNYDPNQKKVIIHATSMAGLVYCPYLASYSAAKAGLHHFTKTMEMEYLDKFTIMSICPKGFGKSFSIKASKGHYQNSLEVETYTKKVVSSFFKALIQKKPKTFCTFLDLLSVLSFFLVPKKILFQQFKLKMTQRLK
jgi:short-subunit dehydrogenase